MTFDPTGKEGYLMTSSKDIYRFIHAGNGELTLVQPENMKAHTYAFLFPRNASDFPENTIFVYVLHNGHKLYLGMLDGSGFRLTRRSSFTEDTESVRGARYIVNMSNRQDIVDLKRMHLYHSGRCCVCGRKLSSSKMISSGIGPKCLKKYNKLMARMPWDGN